LVSYLLFGLFLLACFVLVVAVLLQPGKADAGALFTSSVSSTAFGPRGTQTILAKITIGAAAIFMISALLLSLGIGGPRSVMEGGSAPSPTPTPAVTASPSPEAAATPSEAATPAQATTSGTATSTPSTEKDAKPESPTGKSK
jgi:preprotein translocase subunit SecG